MKKNISKILQILLFVIFILVGLFVWESNYYKSILVEKAFEVYPSSQSREGVYLKNLTSFVDDQGQKLDTVFVNPGAKLEGGLFVKNNFLEEKFVSLVLFNEFSEKSSTSGIVFEPEEKSFKMMPGEWRYVRYFISFPDDISEGLYSGRIAARTEDSLQYKGMPVVLAVAIDFDFEVVLDPFEPTSINMVSFDASPHSVAMKYIYSDIKKKSGYAFGLLAIFFLYKALKTDKRKKK